MRLPSPPRPPRPSRRPKPKLARNYRGMTGEQVVQAVYEDTGPRCMLSFSRGKDSLACWLAMRDVFGKENIVPYYCYFIPGLMSFERESLEYFESVMGTHIITLPYPGVFRVLRDCLLQAPERVPVLQAAELPEFNFGDIRRAVREIAGLPDTALVASGVRSCDSALRRVSMAKHGPVSLSEQQFYPVHDWDKARVIDEISRSGIHLPEDYHLFGRTFDGLDMRFLLPLKRYKPADYQQILNWYPLADMELWLLEKRGVL